MHRFQEAEEVARRLVQQRGAPFDHGLLGDVLMEQGLLEEATQAYQIMLDLKPGLQSYVRASLLRWLRGDLNAAIELMGLAARSGSPRDAEAVAWAYSRLALFKLQEGSVSEARQAVEAALTYDAEHASALLARGKILLAQQQPADAVKDFAHAVELSPLPEYLWWLSEAYLAVGLPDRARETGARIERRGPVDDPRTTALYLATRGREVETAVFLAEQQLTSRRDVFTFDALAWALHRAGRNTEAERAMCQALREGTRDARLYLHAGTIALANDRLDEARNWLGEAHAMRQVLLPSEQSQLDASRARTTAVSSALSPKLPLRRAG
jgi:tetratricopeptide (TPR) repeat protein